MENRRMELVDASRRGDRIKVQELTADLGGKGLNINYHDNEGCTALMSACRNDHVEIVLALLSVDGIDVNVQNYVHGNTALMLACMNNHREVVLALLQVDDIDINVKNKGEYTALMKACMSNLLEIVLALLQVDNTEVNLVSSCGHTALMWACRGRYPNIALDLLLDRRVNRHIVDRDGMNALMLARDEYLPTVVTRIEGMDRGDVRMPMLLVHHRYMYADVADTTNGLHPSKSAIAKALVISGIAELICRYIA